MNQGPILELLNVKHSYNRRIVLDIPDMSFQSGGLYGVVGPNGAGKTTLLKILSFLEEPREGSIRFEGQFVNFSENGLNSLRRQTTLVMQDPLLFHNTVLKNVAYGLWVRGVEKSERMRRALKVLDTVGLTRYADQKAQNLSGGEIQRVAIARALATNPKVLLLDEPTANLDRPHTSSIIDTLRDINTQFGTTIILATHNLRQAYGFSNDVISLLDGRSVGSHPDNLFQGKIVEQNGRTWLSIDDSYGFYIVSDRRGPAYASVDPKEIIVSREPFDSSALNCLHGKIVGLHQEGSLIRLTVDTGVPFVSLITMTSFEEMQLNINTTVYLTFKAASVEVY
ncbi:MAG: ATP-binding cassette domain-containing protein [Gemmatimonadota bacterium]|nr:MAG: ATP-binding cassette domain-containing protein [Gemmatimonadota bacterium]